MGRAIEVPGSGGPLMPPPGPPVRRVVAPEAPLTLLLVGGQEIRAERWYDGDVSDDTLAAVVDAAGFVYLVPADQIAATILGAGLAREMTGTGTDAPA